MLDKNRNKKQGQQMEHSNKVAISPTVSIITLKVKVLMYQLKDRLPQWIKQQDSTECYLQETNFKQKDT